MHITFEFLWTVLTELVNCDLELTVEYSRVTLVLHAGAHVLPGEISSVVINQGVADGLHVIAPRELLTQVRMDACEPSCACERLVVTVSNVLLRLCVDEPLGDSHVHHM